MKYTKDEDFIRKFGKRLKKLREAKGYSQDEFCSLTGLSKSQISRTELGKINTSISHVALYAKLLELDVKMLFDFDEETTIGQ